MQGVEIRTCAGTEGSVRGISVFPSAACPGGTPLSVPTEVSASHACPHTLVLTVSESLPGAFC